jgi:hypothetical protein
MASQPECERVQIHRRAGTERIALWTAVKLQQWPQLAFSGPPNFHNGQYRFQERSREPGTLFAID